MHQQLCLKVNIISLLSQPWYNVTNQYVLTYEILLLHAFCLVWESCNVSYNNVSICLNAKHVQNKATKKHTKRRPKKRRPSDINRKKVEYPELPTPPAEFTVLDMPAVPVTKADFKMELNQ